MNSIAEYQYPESLNKQQPEIFAEFTDETVLELVESETFGMSRISTNIDLLDRLMVIHKISNDSEADITPLIESIEPYCKKSKRTPILTYGDLVLVNPLDDVPRTFLTDQDDQPETSFYQSHREIERWFSVAGLEMFSLAFGGEKEGFNDAEELRYKVITNQAIVKARMAARKAYDDFTSEQYTRWRAYISPEKMSQPPSARLYSPGTMIVKLALGLQDPQDIPDQFDALSYPDYYSDIIESAINRGSRMLDFEENNPSIASHNKWLRRQMDDYDNIHLSNIDRLLDGEN